MLLTLLRDYSGKSREIDIYCIDCYSNMCFAGLVHIKNSDSSLIGMSDH